LTLLFGRHEEHPACDKSAPANPQSFSFRTPFLWDPACPVQQLVKQNLSSHSVVVVTRNSSGDERANVTFFNDDIVHILQNTIDSCINFTTDRRGGYVLECMFIIFSEITQCNGNYAVQGHSRSPILVPIESSFPIPISD